jgi:hypothetical protein
MLNLTQGLKSVQRGTAQLTTDPQDITITAVVLAKSFLLIWGAGDTQAYLLNTTTIRFANYNEAAVPYIAWQVVEYY